MLRLLFVLMTLSLATVVQADVSIHVEDFEDEQGNAGFDPMFNHSFSAAPGESLHWSVGQTPEWYENPGIFCLSLGYGTTDTITFNLPPSAIVIYGSVVLYEGLHASDTSIRFIGSEGSWQSGEGNNGQQVFDITSDQIGVLEQIELCSTQGLFNSVTIGVVPEPGSVCLLFILIGSALVFRVFSRNRHR